MTAPHGLPVNHVEWHQAMMSGAQVDLQVDQRLLRRNLRGNTIGFVGVLVVAGACAVLLAWIIFTDFGRLFTYIMLGVLLVLLLFMALTVRRTRQRLAAARANPTYLSVSRKGLRIAGSVWVPWSESVGALAVDLRYVEVPGRQRIARALHDLIGSSQAMLIVGLVEERARSLRSASDPKLIRLFEVISDTGGLRIPLSAVLSESDTTRALVAVPAAARAAGLEAIHSFDNAEISTGIMSLFMSRPISAEMSVFKAFEEGLQLDQDTQQQENAVSLDLLADVVLNAEGRTVFADARAQSPGEASEGELLLDAGAHPHPITIGWCDAGGEDDPGQVFSSVVEACRNLGLPVPELPVPELPVPDLHDEIESHGNDPVGRLLQEADAGLHRVGLRLLMLDADSDMYSFAPVTAEHYAHLVGQETGGLALLSVSGMVGGQDVASV